MLFIQIHLDVLWQYKIKFLRTGDNSFIFEFNESNKIGSAQNRENKEGPSWFLLLQTISHEIFAKIDRIACFQRLENEM